MKYGRLASSPRLQRALKALQKADGALSTLELARRARICAVSSVVSELRANGADISCHVDASGPKRLWMYTLTKSPKGYE